MHLTTAYLMSGRLRNIFEDDKAIKVTFVRNNAETFMS